MTAARRQLDIGVFTLADDQLFNAVFAAHGRGGPVRIIGDNDKRIDSDIARVA